MSKLIDTVSKAEVLETYAELYDVFDDYKEIKKELHKVYDKLNALPSAQPEIIRCKDCKHYDTHDHRCKWWNHGVSDGWCSYGEAKA